MRALPEWAAALWITAVFGSMAQAAPPQPVIRLPQQAPSTVPDELDASAPAPARQHGCLGDGTGYLRARIRGAISVDLAWKDAQLECDGDARPDGSGLRVTFAGPGPGGKPLRLVFGVSAAHEGAPGRELPTNLTLLVDGGRIYSTRGDDKCTLDQLAQRRLPDDAGQRRWRIEAHGFCVSPANAVTGSGRVLVSRFDFAGRIEFSGRG